ncbi:Serine protease Do-like HtrA [Listeria grayi]|uniref:Putative heat-shock protein htrA serine protease n=1 Tax=Listeria grayi FSL F6-1183 TaxID=1265827 RepID=A0A829RBQ6_LISGR|nr:S1C family serine protease [Listeria grayi]EUJ30419.1 putative heat-shock protein htrA serine protease [Listeria grayi FSL F6-1183]VEI31206.1 Serine protease Do-like HtrA [Listeria grayi]
MDETNRENFPEKTENDLQVSNTNSPQEIPAETISSTDTFFDEMNNRDPFRTELTQGGNDNTPPPPNNNHNTSNGGNGEPPRKGGKGNFIGYFLTGLIGVIVGALIIYFIPWNNDNDSLTNNAVNTTTKGQKVENVSVNTTTNITKAVGKVQDAVVSVLNYQSSGDPLDGNTSEKQASSGSGVIYKKANGKAYIVTNNHVVANAEKLEVTFANGKKASAKLLGTDVWNDLAVLEINGKNVSKVAEFGNSDSLKVGEPAIAIGSPLGTEFSGSVTEGIISGLNRAVPVDTNSDGQEDWEADVIQTDAAVNPGNSGGALINIQGQVIGINSMKISMQNVEGISFSIPINTVEPIIQQLETKGEVVRPSLGVTLRDVETIPSAQQKSVLKLPENINYGAMVQQVTKSSAAAKAGLKQYDVITELNGKKVTNSISLRKELYSPNLQIGDKIAIKYYRDGKLKSTTLTLVALKEGA